ncbi:MAG: VWA domain-containing protein, partial [Desulfobulbaceae bacterium]|nr:VWA domain-containing protein [Desulfobulbaceae bacterium]
MSSEFDFTLKEVSYALNGETTLALKNIKKDSVDPALFKIPTGYTKVVIEKAAGGNNIKKNDKKSAKAEKPLSKTLNVKRMTAHSISLEPDRHIIITATGNSTGGSISSADMKVLDKGNNEIIAEKITLQNGESHTWDVLPDKEPLTLSLSGEKGLIKFKIDQLTDDPAGAGQPPQASIEEKPRVASPPEESIAPANLMFILDASGSMWGQVEGRAKIGIAKEVLTDLITGLPDDTVVGLVAYGHRRKGDCNDVEELITLGPLNKQAMIAQVQNLNPKGKTPISRSVRLTAEGIKYLEDETTIILVSDGKETCDPDPCGLVKDLKAAGVKFIMHVIGFDVTEEEKQELECMAREGGGKYFTAGNAKDFQLAAQEVVKKVSEKPPVSLKVTAVKDGKPIKTYVQILTQGGEKSVTDGWTSEEEPVSFRLPPGIYDIFAQDREVIQRPTVDIKDVEILEGQLIERIVDFATEGIVRIKAIKNNVPIRVSVWVSRQQDKKAMGEKTTGKDGSPVEYALLPGMYKIVVQDRNVRQRP